MSKTCRRLRQIFVAFSENLNFNNNKKSKVLRLEWLEMSQGATWLIVWSIGRIKVWCTSLPLMCNDALSTRYFVSCISIMNSGENQFLWECNENQYSNYNRTKSSKYVHCGPSMLNTGKDPLEGQRGFFHSLWGVFPGERWLGKTFRSCKELGVFPRGFPKVSLLEVDSLWGDCTFIPADWGS